MIEIAWGPGGIAMDWHGAAIVFIPIALAVWGTIILKHKGWC